MELSKTELNEYDYIIVAFSGGKDSQACVLHLLDQGVEAKNIELWHHDVDGREGSTLMDWAVTRDYCQKFADAFGMNIYFSWKEGGFEREMCRNNQLTAPTIFETPEGIAQAGGILGKPGTREKFPQVSPDLSVRWCSAYLKIDVGATAIRNQERFIGKKTLFVTGERAEESTARANYKELEPHRSDNRDGKRIKRHVDQWRPVHKWAESDVWAIIEKYKIQPHPAYRLGWGRVSCAACIFGNADQWASLKSVNPNQFEAVSNYEKKWGVTIKRNEDIVKCESKGQAYPETKDKGLVTLATSTEYTDLIITENWTLPAGAYGDSCGPV